MTPDDRRLVFIGGHHRSGTSLLHRCIRDHPSVSGFENTGAVKDEGQHLQSVYPPGCRFGPVNRYAFDPRAHLTEASPLAREETARAIWNEWTTHWGDRRVLVEKSPPNVIRTRFLQHLFPDARFVILLRHPIAVAFATLKWNAERIDDLLQHWLVCYERFAEDRRRLDHVEVLHYEDLVDQPSATLNRIYGFLGLESYTPDADIQSGLNEQYFRLWRERPVGRFNVAPVRAAARWYCRLQFEERVNRFGYSLDLSSPRRPGGFG
jgi:hypothetical protein